jgi:large subunit ribosomal protein L15
VKIEELSSSTGSRKKPKRVGRGPGSGHGKTSCKGHKGQKARSGSGRRPGFEGGQMPLQRRLPKRGFHNPFSRRYEVVNLADIERLGLDAVTPEVLLERGVIKSSGSPVKVLGDGEIKRALSVKANAFSASARSKIEAAGGSAEVV